MPAGAGRWGGYTIIVICYIIFRGVNGTGPGSIVKFREVPLTALMLPTAGGRWMVAGYLDAGPPRVVGGVRLVRGVGQPRQPADVRLNKWFCKNTENKNRIYQM